MREAENRHLDEAEEEQEQHEKKQYAVKQSATWAGGTLLATLPFDLLGHFGPTGLLVSGLASYVAWRHGPEISAYVKEHLLSPSGLLSLGETPLSDDGKLHPPPDRSSSERSWLDRALGRFPEEDRAHTPPAAGSQGDGDEDEEAAIFQAGEAGRTAPPVPRISMQQALRHTPRNSYEVYLGRSLTRPRYPALKINFFKRHIKIIGASQYGKSSMAAFILEAIIRTHDPERVVIALLDLEHKTSRLFAAVPHLAELVTQAGAVVLHARNEQEVLSHLQQIVALIKYRYTLPESELDRLPLLIVYLEEFIDLKDSFKRRVGQARREEEKAQAQREYDLLVYCIKHIARRGLKAHVQFLLCAQVDYRDDDLQEALVNVTSGLAFCLRPTAAQAAGFYRADLIKRNAIDNQVGTAVVEMPEHKDLVLAPQYDLREKLRRLPPPLPPLPQWETSLDDMSPARLPQQRTDMEDLPCKAERRESSPSPSSSPSPAQTPQFEHGYASSSRQASEEVKSVNGLHRPVNERECFTGKGEYSRGAGERSLGFPDFFGD